MFMKARVMLVEDDGNLRESIPLVLEEHGYEVSTATNGRDAFRQLRGGESIPDVIILDLRMPVMDGWQFRAEQKTDPLLGPIPVLAISADGSAQAAAISAEGYLRKPVGIEALLTGIEEALRQGELRATAKVTETERLASLGRLAAGVGHEINNPLAFMLLNLEQALQALRALADGSSSGPVDFSPGAAPQHASMSEVIEMLEDSVIGGQRIRATVGHLQGLSRSGAPSRGAVSVHSIIEQSVSMVWNQIRHRARLIKTFGDLPLIQGDGAALGQVFLNLLLNAAQALPEGDAKHNEIGVRTSLVTGKGAPEVLVEISDTGSGISSDTLSRVFDPFFTTKPMGQGTGLGLSISHQTVIDHGGRLSVTSTPEAGTVFRVVLPVGVPAALGDSDPSTFGGVVPVPRRVLVIDDEPLIGRVIYNALKGDNTVVVVDSVAKAVGRLEQAEKFDLILCDVVMPDVNGPDFYALIVSRWPELADKMVFMTGGTFTPEASKFAAGLSFPVLIKPFSVNALRAVVQERAGGGPGWVPPRAGLTVGPGQRHR